MLVTMNLYNFRTQKQNKKTVLKNNSYHNYTTATPSFNGLSALLKDVFKKQTPLERAIKYMEKAKKSKYYEKTFGFYGQASETLEKNWDTLDINGQRKYVEAYFGMVEMAKRDSWISQDLKPIVLYNGLFANLALKKSPLLQDSKMVTNLSARMLLLGNEAAEKGEIKTAEKCYTSCKYFLTYIKNKTLLKVSDDVFESVDQAITALTKG